MSAFTKKCSRCSQFFDYSDADTFTLGDGKKYIACPVCHLVNEHKDNDRDG